MNDTQFALIDISPIIKNENEVNHVLTSFSAMRVLGVYETEEEAWQVSDDCWDCSGRQEFRVVPIQRRKSR